MFQLGIIGSVHYVHLFLHLLKTGIMKIDILVMYEQINNNYIEE